MLILYLPFFNDIEEILTFHSFERLKYEKKHDVTNMPNRTAAASNRRHGFFFLHQEDKAGEDAYHTDAD